MNQNIPTLTEILTTELNPDDVKAGAKQIADALAPVSKWVHMIEDRFYGLASLLGFAGVICFAVWLRFQIQFPEFYYLGFLFLILCFLAAMVPQLLWRNAAARSRIF